MLSKRNKKEIEKECMGQENELRYQVSMPVIGKVFYVIWIIIVFVMAYLLGVEAIKVSDMGGIVGFFSVLCLASIIILFVLNGIQGLFLIIRRVEVYRGGKVIYIDMFSKKIFRMSEIRRYKVKEVDSEVHLGEGNYISGCERVTVFYDVEGKKLFGVNDSDRNVDLLKRDVTNVQKSINGNKKK